MEMSGEQLVPAPQREVWDALNDPQMLKMCVPGCESIEKSGDNEFVVNMVARVSSNVADRTSVPNRTCGRTWCSFAQLAM